MVKNQFKENEMSETRKRAKYTLEFKMEAVRLVKGGQAVSVTAKVLGIPKVNLPLFDVPLSHFIMRPSIAVPRPSVFQTSSD